MENAGAPVVRDASAALPFSFRLFRELPRELLAVVAFGFVFCIYNRALFLAAISARYRAVLECRARSDRLAIVEREKIARSNSLRRCVMSRVII